MGQTPSQYLGELEKTSNFTGPELERLKRRFMKLDRDGNGMIDRHEFFSDTADC